MCNIVTGSAREINQRVCTRFKLRTPYTVVEAVVVSVVTVVGATVVVELPDTVGAAVVLGAIVVFPGATVVVLELQPEKIATQATARYFIILENLGTRETVITYNSGESTNEYTGRHRHSELDQGAELR